VPAVSDAATVTVRPPPDDVLVYVAGPGERNDVTVETIDNARLRIADPGAVITATGTCRSIDAHNAVCRPQGKGEFLYEAKVALGDLDDHLMVQDRSGDIELTAEGGPGGDVLTGGPNEFSGSVLDGGDGNDQLYAAPLGGVPLGATLRGGSGDDQLHGSDKAGDELDGGGGLDQLYGGGGYDSLTDGDRDGSLAGAAPDADTLDGGPGVDEVSYKLRKRSVVVRAGVIGEGGEPGEHDRLSGIENVSGGAGDDRLIGDARSNHFDGSGGDDFLAGGAGRDNLSGGRGDDRLDGGEGLDSLYGERGSDRLFGRSGADYLDGGRGIDAVSCGRGVDALVAGRRALASVPNGCEELYFEWLSRSPGLRHALWLRPHPSRTSAGRLQLRTECPVVLEDAPDVGCRGSIEMRESGSRRRLLARGFFSHPSDGAKFGVPLALTPLGVRRGPVRLTRTSAIIVVRVGAERTPRRPFTCTIRSAPQPQ